MGKGKSKKNSTRRSKNERKAQAKYLKGPKDKKG